MFNEIRSKVFFRVNFFFFFQSFDVLFCFLRISKHIHSHLKVFCKKKKKNR